MTTILGISAFYHDSAACLLKNGDIIAAAQEERFSRVKHDSSYPFNAIEFVLNYSNLKLNEVSQIVFFEKPFLKYKQHYRDKTQKCLKLMSLKILYK
jgi:carbamoyltransferase